MSMNKKGAFFLYIILAGLILIVGLVILIPPKPVINYIGEKPLKIIQISLQAEKLLHYIDQSAKLSAYKSIHDLGNNGGFTNKDICGKFLDYNLWNNKTEEIENCFPDYENNLKHYFDNYLKEYLSKYDYYDVSVEYDYVIKKDELKIIGIAKEDIIKDFKDLASKEVELTETTQVEGGYSIKPNFKVEVGFDLNIFDKIKKQSKELVDECSEKKDDELKMCILLKTSSFSPEWKLIDTKSSDTERKFKFNVNTHKKLFPFDNEVIVKFALYFPEPTT